MDSSPAGRGRKVAAPQDSGRDAERTRADILEVAYEEFSRNGLSGARVDEIAEKTRTSKRMIYYYFESKEGLYRAVLEKAYAGIRSLEADAHLEDLAPREALRRLIGLTFDYDEAHPGFIRLVSIENIHHAEHLSQLPAIRKQNASVTHTLEKILARGRKNGEFRSDISALDVHLLISAFCFFRVANRHTFGTIFDRDLSEPKLRAKHRRMIVDAVDRLVELR